MNKQEAVKAYRETGNNRFLAMARKPENEKHYTVKYGLLTIKCTCKGSALVSFAYYAGKSKRGSNEDVYLFENNIPIKGYEPTVSPFGEMGLTLKKGV